MLQPPHNNRPDNQPTKKGSEEPDLAGARKPAEADKSSIPDNQHTVTFRFDNERWQKLQAFYKLPWYKRLFRRLP